MAEQLAYVGKIIALEPIPEADRLVSATVVCGAGGKWQGVVAKSDFEVGALCEVYLQDALVPATERFAFMASRKYRVKIARLRGTLSEALIMPLTVDGVVGDDITVRMRVEKYERQSEGKQAEAKGDFPPFLYKTDEPNVQKSQAMVEALTGQPYTITLKMDGSSLTAYRYNGVFGVCSRRLEVERGDNAFWRAVDAAGIEAGLPDGFAIQAEVCGPKIQGNPMEFDQPTLFIFQVFDIAAGTFLGFEAAKQFCEAYLPQAKRVRLLECGDSYTHGSWDERFAWLVREIPYPVEGVVVRPMTEMRVRGERLSFKVINPDYKEAK